MNFIKNMSKKIENAKAIAKVKKFLLKNKICHKSDLNGGWFYNFDESYKPYYIIYTGEYHGCSDSSGAHFAFKNEVNDLVKKQLKGGHYYMWDDITIFDVNKNKEVFPKV